MHTETYKVKGMHCASCAGIIERTFKKIDGVNLAEVNYGTENAKISFDKSKTNPKELSKKIEPFGYSLVVPTMDMTAGEMGMSENEHAEHLGLNQSKKEKLEELSDMKNKIISVIPLAVISIFVMASDILSQYKIGSHNKNTDYSK